jgi:hypothetical protein
MNNLYNNYTLETLIDELDIIIKYMIDEKDIHYSKINSKQSDIYKYMDVEPLEQT